MSSSDLALVVRGLSKCYNVARSRTVHSTLAETVLQGLRNPWGFFHRPTEHFWALSDVSFEVKKGEVIGVIGRNGAGKSTLLKVLSRITEPTEGTIDLYGRVGSLLEVGTGFHPELTGRENIFLNGAILGMTKGEIRRCFNDIVEFAEVQKFLETPVKRYSSGMYVRLAFAVAAHLNPEILIVDEVLAVGDASFQKKCLEKMGDVAKEGRTVLFVSHNMHAVSLLCPQAMLLDRGRIAKFGPTPIVASEYLINGAARSAERAWPFAEAPTSENVRLKAVRAASGGGSVGAEMPIDEPIQLEMEFWILQATKMTPSFHVYNAQGVLLFALGNMHEETWGDRRYVSGLYKCSCTIPANYLNEGAHFVTIYLTRDNNAGLVDIRLEAVVGFSVIDDGRSRGGFVHEWAGLVRPILPWKGEHLGDLPGPAENFRENPGRELVPANPAS